MNGQMVPQQHLPFLPLHPSLTRTYSPSCHKNHKTMEGLISVQGCLQALVFLTFFLGRPDVPDTPQFPPGSSADSPSAHQVVLEAHDHDLNIVGRASRVHDSSSPPPTQVHNDGTDPTLDNRAHGSSPLPLPTENYGHTQPNISVLSSGAYGSSRSPSEPQSSSSVSPGTHSSSRIDNLIINESVDEKQHSPMLRPTELDDNPGTSTGASLLLGAHDFVINNLVINTQGDSNTVAKGETR